MEDVNFYSLGIWKNQNDLVLEPFVGDRGSSSLIVFFSLFYCFCYSAFYISDFNFRKSYISENCQILKFISISLNMVWKLHIQAYAKFSPILFVAYFTISKFMLFLFFTSFNFSDDIFCLFSLKFVDHRLVLGPLLFLCGVPWWSRSHLGF